MKNLLKVIKPQRLVFLILLLVGNTFAWFIYSSKVDGALSVHVKAWDVTFQADQSQVVSNLDINVDSLYPGMTDYTYDITAYNNSEVPATLSYRIISARILGTDYLTSEAKVELGEEPDEDDLTSEDIIDMLENDFPFSISFNISNALLEAETGEENCTLTVTWPFEQNDDEEDTRWGIAAAEFKEDHPRDPSISLKVKLTITQNIS